MMTASLTILPETYALIKLDTNSPIPDEIYKSSFLNISKSKSELSVLCEQKFAEKSNSSDLDWRLFKYEGSIESNETGIVASIVDPLAYAGISVIVYTTYDNGYFGVNSFDLSKATALLLASGIKVNNSQSHV